MTTAQELRAKAQKIDHDIRSLIESINETNGSDVDAQIARADAEATAIRSRADQLEAIEARDAALNAADSRRPVEDRSIESRGSQATREERQAAAFDAYVRGDIAPEQRALLTELRAQNVATPADGGYLVPETWASSLIVGMKAFGPMTDGSVVNVISTATGAKLNLPSMDDTANKGRRIAEGAQGNSVTLAFGNKELDAYKYTSDIVLVSSELFQDSAIDIQSVITAAMSERLGRILNEELTVGTGSSQPNGIATAATAGVTLGANASVAADDLISLQHSVDPAYRGQGAFMLNDSTFAAIRKLKDTSGQYLWQPGLTVGAPATIAGSRFYVNQNIANVGSGNKSVLFGDFSRYTVRVVKGFALKRLNERYADYDQVGFVGFARYDGELMDSRAIRALVNS